MTLSANDGAPTGTKQLIQAYAFNPPNHGKTTGKE
jgi:hypothetical protein